MSGFDLPMRVEWRRRAEFAEYGEAIGIESDLIVAARSSADREVITVLYVKVRDADESATPVWAQTLVRDRRGILRLYSDPTIVIPSLARLFPA